MSGGGNNSARPPPRIDGMISLKVSLKLKKYKIQGLMEHGFNSLENICI